MNRQTFTFKWTASLIYWSLSWLFYYSNMGHANPIGECQFLVLVFHLLYACHKIKNALLNM